MTSGDQSIVSMKERVRDALIALAQYRTDHPEDPKMESIMTQLEFVQEAIESEKSLTHAQKNALDFNLVEGTPLEHDEDLTRELYSIRNYAMNSL